MPPMGTSGERRRAADDRPPQPGFGPTPGAVGPPDPEGFARTLSAALEGARRARRALTLVRIEVVPRGGADGERELCEVARLVRATVRESDGIWRDGPASLALLLADTDGPNAEPALARMRLRLRGRVHADVLIGRAAAQPGVSAGVLQELARSDARSISVP
jgi:GGDEF domain-containing protein